MRKSILVLLVLLTAAVMLSSCAGSFPKKDRIVKLSREEATEMLKGRTEEEISDHWGEPDGMLSGFYGDIYFCDGKQIVIYYDGESKVTDVLVSGEQDSSGN